MADAADIVNGYEVKSGRRNRFVQHEGGRRIDQVWDKADTSDCSLERPLSLEPAIPQHCPRSEVWVQHSARVVRVVFGLMRCLSSR